MRLIKKTKTKKKTIYFPGTDELETKRYVMTSTDSHNFSTKLPLPLFSTLPIESLPDCSVYCSVIQFRIILQDTASLSRWPKDVVFKTYITYLRALVIRKFVNNIEKYSMVNNNLNMKNGWFGEARIFVPAGPRNIRR